MQPLLLSRKALFSRGWAPAMIAEYLDPPDTIRATGCSKRASSMKLYSAARVEAAERSRTFPLALAEGGPAVVARKRAADQARADLLRRVDELHITVHVPCLDSVRQAAEAAHAGFTRGRRPPEWLDRATPDTIAVEHIRRGLDGAREIEARAWRTGDHEAVRAVRGRAYAAIAAALPELADACRSLMRTDT